VQRRIEAAQIFVRLEQAAIALVALVADGVLGAFAGVY